MGGGIFTVELVEKDETWETTLEMGSFVRIDRHGKYNCQVMYHNNRTIADYDHEDLDDLIIFRSEKFELHIEKGPFIDIALSPEREQLAKALVNDLQPNSQTRIVVGGYDSRRHKFIDPDSVSRKILSMGIEAAPAMLAALEDEALNENKRANIFGLLYSIIDEEHLSPTIQRGVLSSLPLRVSRRISSGGGRIEAKRQLEFANTWLEFRDEYIRIDRK